MNSCLKQKKKKKKKGPFGKDMFSPCSLDGGTRDFPYLKNMAPLQFKAKSAEFHQGCPPQQKLLT